MVGTIQTVGVIGAGQMGNGIAHVCALAGYSVMLNDVSPDRIKAGMATINGNMTRQVSKKTISEDDRNKALGRIKGAEKYDALGGCTSVIGAPITEERGTPDGVGRYSVFESGSIYWTPQLGAHEVHGMIRDAWAASGWEAGPLGYPISDEYADGDHRRSDFQHGSIVWSAADGATTIP